MGMQSDGEEGVVYVNNQLRFTVKYHRPEGMPDVYRIVGVEAEPVSVAAGAEFDGEYQRADADEIEWSYSVEWEESGLLWRERWDPILALPEAYMNAHVKTFFISLALGTAPWPPVFHRHSFRVLQSCCLV